jgi:hypothetical protein
VNTSIGLGVTPPVDVAPHPVVVPPPAQSPQSQVAGYFERADLHSVRPPAPDAGSVQSTEKDAAPRASIPSAGDVDLGSALPPSPLDKAKVALSPLLAKGRELSAKNRLFLPVAGVVGASFAVLFVAILVKACSSDPSPAKAASASASASASSGSTSSGSASALASALPTASSTSVTSASASAAAVAEAPSRAAKVACKLEGAQVSLAEKAVVSAGAEVLAKDDVLAVGFAKGPKEGEMIKLGEGLAPSPPIKLRMGDPLRRVQPVFRRGKLELAVEIDRKVSGLSSRRVVAFDPPFDVGVNERGLGYGPHGKGATKDLFALEGDGAVEALRVAPVPGKKGVAVAFRRSGAVHAGVAEGDDLAPRGTLQKVAGLGAQVGSPTIAVSGDSYLVAFADRATADAPWSLRTFGGKVGSDASAAKTFEVPKGGPGGGVISPSLSPIDGGFLLVWTEGPENAHQVRAQALDLDGTPSGDPMGISTAGVNAGQGRAAVNAAGQGVVVYFASKESGFELVGAKIACTKGSP